MTGSSGSSSSSNSRRYSLLSASNLIQAPISTLLEYSGLLRTRPNHLETEPLFHGGVSGGLHGRAEDSTVTSNDGEVSIRIIGAGEQEHHRERAGLVVGQQVREAGGTNEASTRSPAAIAAADGQGDARSGAGEGASQPGNGGSDSEGGETNGRESSYQRYDIQQAARWIEQILPFSLLLLVVFIRQHLQGIFLVFSGLHH